MTFPVSTSILLSLFLISFVFLIDKSNRLWVQSPRAFMWNVVCVSCGADEMEKGYILKVKKREDYISEDFELFDTDSNIE